MVILAATSPSHSSHTKTGNRTFDRVRLHELRTVRQEGLRDGVPGHGVGHAEVDMGGGELVDVEPDVLWPRVLYQVLI